MLRTRSNGKAGARRRVVLTFLDQVVSSASNFLTGVAIARLSGAAQFGEYMLVLLVWLLVVGVHRKVVTEPMIVTTGNSDARPAPIAHGLSAELLLGAVASVLLAATGLVAIAAGVHMGATMLAFSPWFVPLLVQDYWRAIAFQRRRPGLALANDVTFSAVQIVGIVGFSIVGWRTGGYMIAAWGAGATTGALLGLTWFRAIGGWLHGWQLLRRLWPLSRWLLADFLTVFASLQAYVAFAALLLSKVDYGGFRAAASLMGPTMVILLSAGNVGLPEASRRADADDLTALRLYVRRLTAGTLCCTAAYGLALAVAARPVLRELYGAEFARFAPLAILAAIQYVVIVTVFGHGIALRATGRMRRLWRIRVVITGASLPSLVLLVHLFGVNGAGWAGVATGVYEALATYLVYRRELGGDRGRRPEDVPLIRPVSEPSVSVPVVPSDGVVT